MENSASASEQATPNVIATSEEAQPVSQGLYPSTNDDELGSFTRGPLQTSTPTRCRTVGMGKPFHPRNNNDSANCLTAATDVSANETGGNTLRPAGSEDFVPFKIPIIGYETIEEREKFTVYKLEVRKNSYESWFIFRRYSDFQRLKRQLKRGFPDLHLPLPPKKYFGGNFDTVFLDERMIGLQNFVDFIISNKEINSSDPVTQFFCYDEPPGPYESLEESRALCESLEDQIYRLTVQLQERDEKIRKLEAELDVSNERIDMLKLSEDIKLKHISYS